MRRGWWQSTTGDLTASLLVSSAVCLVLYAVAIHHYGGLVFTYLPWNLFLAWLPLLLSVLLLWILKRQPWSSWWALLVSLLWLLFLPNSFYMVTDFIHLDGVFSDDLVTAAVLFSAFVFTGLLLGFASLYRVHRELDKRLSAAQSWASVAAIVALCSFAIYIGRDLRWNSWDMLTNPAGLLFDISDRLLHVSEYGSILAVAANFFVLLMGMYVVVWRLTRLSRRAG